MAEDYDTRPVYEVARIADRPREQPRHRPPPSPGRRALVDGASVMGIPEDHLTPQVQEAITTLMAEIDQLRGELDQHQHREAWLDELAHHHPLVPIFNRRGLMRELAKLLGHLGQIDLACSLLFIHVGGVERLRVLHGVGAGDAALRHLATAIAGCVRQTDVVANMGGSDFVVMLTLADHAAARTKADEIAAIISSPFEWEGRPVHFSVSVGLHDLGPGDDAEHAIAAADLNRRQAAKTTAARSPSP